MLRGPASKDVGIMALVDLTDALNKVGIRFFDSLGRPRHTAFGKSRRRGTSGGDRDEHVPESLVEILGYSIGGITYRHYALRAPLAFRAIMTLPQPTAFQALVRDSGSECPCCQRRFADAG